MSDLQTLIRDHYDHMVEPVSAVEAAGRIAKRDQASLRYRRPVARGILVAVAAAVAILLIAGIPLLLSQSESAPVVDDPPPLIPPSEIQWSGTPVNDGFISQAVTVGDGFAGLRIQIDETSDPDNPIYTATLEASEDGVSWTEANEFSLASNTFVWWLSGNEWGAAGRISDMEGLGPPDQILISKDLDDWRVSDLGPALDPSDRGGQAVRAIWNEKGIVVVH